MTDTYILALDQGTSSSRAVLFDRTGQVVHQVSQAFPQHYPQPGWVEHDPADLWHSQLTTAQQVLQQASVHPTQVAALGVTNQRETTLIWDRATGEPIYPAIVWQCRRTAPLVEVLRSQGWDTEIQQRTGLVLDAYFSATKVQWLLHNVPGARTRALQGQLAFGTVDTWLLYKLSGGRLHCTDYSNAARTMLYNIHTRSWDTEILRALDIPAALLPEVRDSSGVFGTTAPGHFDGAHIPIGGVIGDQQGALFGQACFTPGAVKNTYGTGSFVLMHSGAQPVAASHGLLSTIAWGLHGVLTYALEGSIFSTGSAMQWLRDELRILRSAAESERLAASVPDTQWGVFRTGVHWSRISPLGYVCAWAVDWADAWHEPGAYCPCSPGSDGLSDLRCGQQYERRGGCASLGRTCGWGCGGQRSRHAVSERYVTSAGPTASGCGNDSPGGCLSGRLSRGLLGKPGSDCGELAPGPYLYATDVRGSS